jgi:glycosyltransferase involved in cell wall biosynthesis
LADEARELALLGHDVIVFATGDTDRDARVDGRDLSSGAVRVLAPRASRLGRARFVVASVVLAAVRHPLRLRRLVRASRRNSRSRRQFCDTLYLSAPLIAQSADIVHFAWIDLAKVCIDLLPLLDSPVVVSCTGSDLLVNPLSGLKYHEPIRAVFDQAGLVRCFSDDLLEHALEFGLDPGKVIVSHWGVDTTFFCPDPARTGDDASTATDARTGPLRVVGVGHLHWVKGYEYAIQAVKRVREAGVEISYEILGRDAGALQSVRTTVRDLGLEEQVIVRGACSRTEVLAALRAADVFMLASLSEGRCTAKLEAMAVGVPVVVTDVGGMAEGLTDGVDAIVVPSRDPAALETALLDLARDPVRRRKIGEAGRKRVCADSDAEQSARLMVEQYQRLLSERAPA